MRSRIIDKEQAGEIDRWDVPSVDASAADALRGLEYGRRVQQRLDFARVGVFHAFGERRQHRLADREVAGAGDRHDALAGLGEDVELAERRDVVETGIGAGVGDHDEPVAYKHSAAIGHFRSSET